MKTKLFFTVIILMLITLSMQGQNTTYFAGHVYSEDETSGKQTMIPFSTIKLYNLNTPDKIIAVRISALDGSYDLKGFDTDDTYIIKVKAPGVVEQSFVTRPNNGKIKSGNLSTHIHLKIEKAYKNPVQKQTFTPKSISDEKDISIIKIIGKIPGLVVENEEITTEDGGSVRLMINGFNIVPDFFAEVKDYPASEVVKSMDYYDLTPFEGSAYDGVLNLRLAAGREATTPNFKFISLKEYK